MKDTKPTIVPRVLISGGGTGGHIYPAFRLPTPCDAATPRPVFCLSEPPTAWK